MTQSETLHVDTLKVKADEMLASEQQLLAASQAKEILDKLNSLNDQLKVNKCFYFRLIEGIIRQRTRKRWEMIMKHFVLTQKVLRGSTRPLKTIFDLIYELKKKNYNYL